MAKDTLSEIQANLQKLQGMKKQTRDVEKVKRAVAPKMERPKRHPAEFELFKVWLSIPAQFIGQAESQLNKLGITDPQLIALCQIRNQSHFATTYKLDAHTPTEWRKELHRDPEVLKSYQSFGQSLTKNLIMSLYLNALKHGDAERIKAWMTFVEGWSPRETVIQTTTTFDVVGFMKEMRARAEAEKAKLQAEHPNRYEQTDRN